MRAHGVLDRVAGLGVSDHVCWDYSSDEDFFGPGLAWVSDGLDLGVKVMYVADKSEHWMMDDLRALGGKALRARDRGALEIRPLADIVSHGDDPDTHLATYDELTRRASADGYTGLRVLAEVTPLVRDPSNHGPHTRWERLLDRYIVDHPLAALCAYDRRLLGNETTSALSCVHPLRRGRSNGSTFSLFATHDGLYLDGDVDTFQAALLDRTLAERTDQDELVIHIGPNTFLDAAATTVLAEHAQRARAEGRTVRLTDGNETVRRVWDLLGYAEIVPIE